MSSKNYHKGLKNAPKPKSKGGKIWAIFSANTMTNGDIHPDVMEMAIDQGFNKITVWNHWGLWRLYHVFGIRNDG